MLYNNMKTELRSGYKRMAISVTIPIDMVEKLKKLRESSGLSVSQIITLAVKNLLEKSETEVKQEKEVVKDA
jgi:metal-responsive CopG/Arc/MetJ family transcriptional regulator